MRDFLYAVGEVAWVLMFMAPLMVIFLVWKFVDGSRMIKVVIWFLLSVIFSFFFYCVSVAIGLWLEPWSA